MNDNATIISPSRAEWVGALLRKARKPINRLSRKRKIVCVMNNTEFAHLHRQTIQSAGLRVIIGIIISQNQLPVSYVLCDKFFFALYFLREIEKI